MIANQNLFLSTQQKNLFDLWHSILDAWQELNDILNFDLRKNQGPKTINFYLFAKPQTMRLYGLWI